VIIGFFAGLCGSNLLENNFGLLTIAVLGIAGILLCLGGSGSAFLGWRKVEGARSTRIKKNAPQIKSGWDYRARKAIRPYPIANSAGAETSEVLSPERLAINNNVWLSNVNNDSPERAAHTFMNLEPMVEDATTKATLSDHKSPVSVYD
jgi:hypothetical protein